MHTTKSGRMKKILISILVSTLVITSISVSAFDLVEVLPINADFEYGRVDGIWLLNTSEGSANGSIVWKNGNFDNGGFTIQVDGENLAEEVKIDGYVKISELYDHTNGYTFDGGCDLEINEVIYEDCYVEGFFYSKTTGQLWMRFYHKSLNMTCLSFIDQGIL